MTKNPTSASREQTAEADFQRVRIGLYLQVLFLIHVGFLAVSAIQFMLGLDLPGASAQSAWEQAIMGLLTGGLGGGWWLVSRGCPPRGVLHALDAIVPPMIGILYIRLVASSGLPPAGLLVLMLVSLALVLRAALVPSSVGRTVVVGTFGVATAMIGGLLFDTQREAIQPLWLGAMGGAFIAVTAVTSSVIYGLRKEVRAATRLGQYELTRKLGEGGMGIVYQATHVLLRRPTAIKLLPPEKAGEDAIARFEREVRQTSRLEHPNNVAIYDYGRTPDGQFYYAMEYLQGLDLEQLVRRHGPLGDARVVHLLRQAALALAEAHGMGLVHRDVKPSNIMVCNRGGVPDTVKLLDYGLVKAVGAVPPDDAARTPVTQPTTVVGTPHYLAPEAIREATVGPSADVYALGAVGYFLLTGAEVFPGSPAIEVLAKHLTARPPELSPLVGRTVDPRLADLLKKCLAKDPAHRYRDGHDLAAALTAVRLGGWDEDDAWAWWEEHGTGTLSNAAPSRASDGDRTELAIDVRSRRGS